MEESQEQRHVDAEAQALADATISHFTSQLGAVDKAIALTIDNDCDLQSKRDLLLSISGVGETLAGVVLAELAGPDVLRSSAEVVAYAGLNPRQHQSGTSIDRATRISDKIMLQPRYRDAPPPGPWPDRKSIDTSAPFHCAAEYPVPNRAAS